MNTEVTIRFDTGNAAFDDGNGPDEAADILDRIARMIRECYTSGLIHDSNGNRVGEWSAEFPEQEEEEEDDDDDAEDIDGDEPEQHDDSPSLDNCDDAGTGEGRYHGRI